jgi:RNA polymerase sigma-70 factor (ECF subfamily)
MLNKPEMNISTLNETTFEDLFYEYSPRLVNYARHFLQDEYAAEELVQETFIKLWEKYRGRTSSTWPSLIFTMLRNGCMDRLRSLSARKGLKFSESIGDLCDEGLYRLEFLAGSTSDGKTLYDELMQNLNEKVDSLPPRCREVFIMSRQEGKTNREISKALGISEKAVEKHITKALKVMDEITR